VNIGKSFPQIHPMKKILLSLVVLVLLIVIGGVGYLYYSLNSLVKKAVETVGPTITKTDVRLASASLSPSREAAS